MRAFSGIGIVLREGEVGKYKSARLPCLRLLEANGIEAVVAYQTVGSVEDSEAAIIQIGMQRVVFQFSTQVNSYGEHSIPQEIINSIKILPPSVKQIALTFNGSSDEVTQLSLTDLGLALLANPNIKHLDLSQLKLGILMGGAVSELYNQYCAHIESIKLGNVPLSTPTFDMPPNSSQTILDKPAQVSAPKSLTVTADIFAPFGCFATIPARAAALPTNLQELCLEGSESWRGFSKSSKFYTKEYFIGSSTFFRKIIGRKSLDGMGILFASLPKVEKLKLRHFYFISPSTLAISAQNLSLIKEGTQYLDISHNGIDTLLEEQLGFLLASLPTSITTLKLVEKVSDEYEESYQRYQRELPIPAHIKGLDFSDLNINADTIDYLSMWFNYLPRHIERLDFSNNNLAYIKPAVSHRLFSAIGRNITSLVLDGNNLAYLSKVELQNFFRQIPDTVRHISLKGNGFNFLPMTELNEKLKCVGEGRVIDLEGEGLFYRQDGKIVSLAGSDNRFELYQPVKQLRYCGEFDDISEVVDAHLEQQGLPLSLKEDCLALVEYDKRLNSTKEKTEWMLSVLAPQPKESVSLIQAAKATQAVSYRLLKLSAKDTHLDLSQTNITAVDAELIRREIHKLPRINSLSLRGNGLSMLEVGELINYLTELFKNNTTVYHLDLSDNGIEQLSDEQLLQLLAVLPKRLQTISTELSKPVMIEDYIRQRITPASYLAIARRAETALALTTDMLRDYSKDGSWFWLTITLHWYRHHVAEVQEIVEKIQNETLTTSDDVISELNKIGLENQAGSLARRLSFLTRQPQQLPSLTDGDTGTSAEPEMAVCDDNGLFFGAAF